MLKVAIIGCGKIADQHAAQIRRIPGCEIVAACDAEVLMAKQFCERCGVKHYFTDAHEMLDAVRPDVVHVTTPPQSHYDLARLCLENGSNVYVEKPFTLYTSEAEELLDLASSKGLKLTVGHNAQFSHAARRMRKLVGSGYLGDGPVHMDSFYCYDLSDPRYAKAVLGDANHWVRKLPGKLLQNIISHGISKIAEFLSDDNPDVHAYGVTSPQLRRIGEAEIVDELRVLIQGNSGATAYFTFSSQMRPVLHQFRLYGQENGLIVDDDHQTLIRLYGRSHKSYLNQFVPPWGFARQYLGNFFYNFGKFLGRDFHGNAGMKCLIESFYRSTTGEGSVPIPYREILLTSRIMDAIFAQLESHSGVAK